MMGNLAIRAGLFVPHRNKYCSQGRIHRPSKLLTVEN
jgi:hypothetical protein